MEKELARLMLPYGKTYEIDIDGIESYDFVELPERSGRMNYYIVYDPTEIEEKIVNDTVYQKIVP
jgi:sugar-specific transcriptional regulator TrmB